MPQPITSQTQNTNSMSLYEGQCPAVDADGIIRNLSWSPRISIKTASFTALTRETGTFFTVVGSTAAVVATLPVLVSGTSWIYEFFNGTDQNLTVTAGTADTAITFNDLAADSVAFSTSSEKIGGQITAFTDGTNLFIVANGSKENQHITVNT